MASSPRLCDFEVAPASRGAQRKPVSDAALYEELQYAYDCRLVARTDPSCLVGSRQCMRVQYLPPPPG